MLVKYANFVKIQPIAPDKRVRPKASNLLVNLIEPLSLKYYRSESSTPFRLEILRKHTALLTHLAKHTKHTFICHPVSTVSSETEG